MRSARVVPVLSAVDDVLLSVDREFQNIARSADIALHEALQMSGPASAVRVSTSAPLRDRPQAFDDQPLLLESMDDEELDSNYRSRKNGAKDDDDSEGEARTTQESEEEVKMSHELLAEPQQQTRLADYLAAQFQQLRLQAMQYQQLYHTSLERLKDAEAKAASLAQRVEDLEEEKAELGAQLQSDDRHAPQALPTSTAVEMASSALALKAPATLRTQAQQAAAQEMNRRSDAMRKALLFENDEEDTGITVDALLHSKDTLSVRIQQLVSFFTPFRTDIRTIQARFGSAVAAYFMFYRFLFLLMSVIAVVVAGFFVWHLINLAQRDTPIDWYLLSQGFLPNVMAVSSFTPAEGLLYVLAVLVPLCVFFVALLSKLVFEDRVARELRAMEAESATPFSQQTLAAWDFSLTAPAEITDHSANIGNKLLLSLEEARLSGIRRSRTQYETVIVVLRRATGSFLFLFLVVSSFAIIIYVTINNGLISRRVARLLPAVGGVEAVVVPLILNVINGGMPTLLKAVIQLEAWDSAETVSNTTLLRIYLSTILNTMLVAFSYLILADSLLLAETPALRNALGVALSDNFRCRLDQAAEGIFTLCLFTWALDAATLLFTPLGYKALAYVRKTPFVKSEFAVAEQMVRQLNFMGLLLLSLPFCPLAFVLSPLLLGLGFKWEKFVVKHFYSKPQRQWNGRRAGLFYTVFFLWTYVLVGLVVAGYFFTSKSFAKDCNIQDAFVRLCADTVVGDVCTLQTTSKYYAYYKNSLYPQTICTQACGPFVRVSSHFAPFRTAVMNSGVVGALWQALFYYPYLPWLGVIVLSVVVAVDRNTLLVVRFSAFAREKLLTTLLSAADAEKRRQERIVKRLKAIESEFDTDADAENQKDKVL